MITASVVSHGQQHLLQQLIAGLHQVRPALLKQLIVTLNMPEPDLQLPRDISFDVITVRNDRPLGFGANHNQAFRRCETEWFAILNPDLIFTTDCLAELVRTARSQDGLVAPLVFDTDGEIADSARLIPTPLSILRRRLDVRARKQEREFDWLAGMFLLVRREAFASVGGFDERYFMYCEDVDLCLRLQLAGWRIKQIEHAHVVHGAQRASRRQARHLIWHLKSMALLWTSSAFWDYLRRSRSMSIAA